MTPEELQEQIAAKTAEIEAIKPKEQEVKAESAESIAEAVESAPQEDSIEAEAIKMGWDPNHQGPNKKSAEQFVKDGSFFRKIESQNKKIDDLLKVVKGLDEHAQKLQRAEEQAQRIGYEKAMRDLQIKRAEAVEEGDLNKFHKVEAELSDLNKSRSVESAPQAPGITQDMKDWADENKSWFNLDNKRLLKEADGLYVLEKEDHPDYSDRQLLDLVKSKIQILHPEKFENPNKSKPADIIKPKSTVGSSISTGLEAKLSPRQLSLYKQAKAAGVTMTIQDYAKQLEITGDLRND